MPLLGSVIAKKPADNTTLATDYHAVNFFGYNDVRWMSKDAFNLKDEADLKPFIDKLIAELQTAKDKEVAEAQKK
jgi:hypothetical protein